jgi:methylenetetrahydrofolate dehydrogenase (NADP+)/methenyltetrahydrofolate cyclohydrolase
VANIIDGKKIASEIKANLKSTLEQHRAAGQRPPGLAVILVGDDPASHIYVRHKQKACEHVGIISQEHRFHAKTNTQAIAQCIEKLNNDPCIDGILLQLPLPKNIQAQELLETIRVDKDVDGFHPYNLGRLAQRRPSIRPCTPYGIIRLLEAIGAFPLHGQEALVVGASNIVGRPMALELLLAGCTTSVCHRFSTHLEQHVRQADILISAAGKAHLIHGDWIKSGAIVFDVSIIRQADGHLVGDIDFDNAKDKASWITPVPGGVGPMTIAMLLENTVQQYQQHIT